MPWAAAVLAAVVLAALILGEAGHSQVLHWTALTGAALLAGLTLFNVLLVRRAHESGATPSAGQAEMPAAPHVNSAHLASILEIRDYAIITVDKSRHVRLFNKGAELIFGYQADAVVGRPLDTVLDDRFLEPGRRRLQDLRRSPGAPVLGKRRDGARFPLEVCAARHGRGSRMLYTLVLRDITEHVQLKDQLRLSTKVFEHSIEGIVITDAAGRILSVNNAFRDITGYGPEEAVGKHAREIGALPHDPEFYGNIVTALRDSGRWEGEVWDRRKDGEVLTLAAKIKAVKDERGAVSNYLVTFADISAAKLSEERLKHLTHNDALTGLPNRLSFQDRLKLAMVNVYQSGRQLAVLFIDLDRFKIVNDSLGHAAGDLLLKAVGRRISDCVRDEDVVARLGGDEFAVILGNLMMAQDAEVATEKIMQCLARPFRVGDQEMHVSASVGVSLYPADGSDVQTLMKNADSAVFRAKEQGRSCYQLYQSAMNAATFEALVLENNLRKALEQDEIQVYYQPKVVFRTGRIVGLEALARWHHPELGMISPAQFIPLAEETGLIMPLGERVLRAACLQYRQWKAQGLADFLVAVNLSPRQFRQTTLVDNVARIIGETGMDPAFLELEITESGAMGDADFTIDTLRRLRAMGVTVTIDDFGTGYSSLGYLKRFPINNLKIDRSFVQDINSNPDSAAITTAIVAMARSLNLKTIAEGVETVEQLDYLHNLRCDEMQGFIFSPPLPADKVTQLLIQARRSLGGAASDYGLRSALERIRSGT